jgi:hypothetical protein
MPHSRFVDADGVLITTLSGVVTLKEMIELEEELRSYVHGEDVYELVLHSDDVEIALDRNESIISANHVKSILNEFRNGAIAFVSDKDFVFGLCRQLQIRAQNELIQMCVFPTEEAARKWLLEMQSSNSVTT